MTEGTLQLLTVVLLAESNRSRKEVADLLDRSERAIAYWAAGYASMDVLRRVEPPDDGGNGWAPGERYEEELNFSARVTDGEVVDCE